MSTENLKNRGDAKVKDVAEYLGLHPETVSSMARSGDFPSSYKTGAGRHSSHIRIPWTDVEAWRAKQPRASR